MEGIHRQLLEGETWFGDSTGPFFGFMGAAAALVFACASGTLAGPYTLPITAPHKGCLSQPLKAWILLHRLTGRVCPGFGAAYGTAKSGVGIASMGVMRPELVMKSIVPVVMAGVLGIYGLIIAVIISTGSRPPD